jgi:2-polyprenyl-6-methoxyphenol hydroxylase-like FAD-dependent oxidoreductase
MRWMPHALVLGASTAGTLTALVLARDGWEVTVVDPELEQALRIDEVVAPRAGAPHRVQAHAFMARARWELSRRLPDVHRALLDAGAHEVGIREVLPGSLDDGGRPGDEDLVVYQLRRVVLDAVLARALRGADVALVRDRPTGLRLSRDRSDGPPRVTGVALRDGGTVEADVLVDAAGRRSPVAGWLRAAGCEGDETAVPCGVRYYGRHYTTGPGERPAVNGSVASVSLYPSLDLLWFPSDGETAVLAAAVHDGDTALKAMRHAGALDAIAREDPTISQWLDLSQPTSEVFAMGTVTSRLRRLVRDSRPVALGIHHVGDSLCATNPTRGRGISMTLAAVGVLTDLLREHHPDDATVLRHMDAWVVRSLVPYFLEAANWDAEQGRRKRAALEGRLLPQTTPFVLLPEGSAVDSAAVQRASGLDPEVARAMVRAQWLMDDERHIGSADLASRVQRVLQDADAPEPPAPPPTDGLYDRRHVVELVSAWLP